MDKRILSSEAQALGDDPDLIEIPVKTIVSKHFSGSRSFTELKKRAVRIDFSSNIDLQEQVTDSLISDYSFQKYIDRIKLINSLLNPDDKYEVELMQIKKHIFIRNSVQHHGSRVYNDMFRELGSSKLIMLDGNADAKELNIDEQIILSIPELDALKRAIPYWLSRPATALGQQIFPFPETHHPDGSVSFHMGFARTVIADFLDVVLSVFVSVVIGLFLQKRLQTEES